MYIYITEKSVINRFEHDELFVLIYILVLNKQYRYTASTVGLILQSLSIFRRQCVIYIHCGS